MADITIHIPKELESAAPEIRRFIDAMLYKLRKNAHKGKWENQDVDSAMMRMTEELDELRAAITEKNTVEMLLEAADVANFALILANIAITGKQK